MRQHRRNSSTSIVKPSSEIWSKASLMSNDVSQLFALQKMLWEKEEMPDFDPIACLMNVSAEDLTQEWKILRRLPGDIMTNQNLVDLAVSSEKMASLLSNNRSRL